MKKNIAMVGIILGLCFLVLGAGSTRLWKLPEGVGLAFSAGGGATLGFFVGMRSFLKMKNDKALSREMNDERNIAIKYESGYITLCITLILMAVATVLFIALEYYKSACIVGSVLIISPIILAIVTSRVEKKI